VVGIRKSIFTVCSPLPASDAVRLYEDTWFYHIIANHVDLAGKELLVAQTVINPTFITIGTSNPDYVIFVNHRQVTPGGTPLIAVVDPQNQVVCTAMYNRSYRIVPPERRIWPK
jgi:hypothetical protein